MKHKTKFHTIKITDFLYYLPSHNCHSVETKNFLDKLRQPPYYDNKGIYDSKLVFDLQAQLQNSVKNLVTVHGDKVVYKVSIKV